MVNLTDPPRMKNNTRMKNNQKTAVPPPESSMPLPTDAADPRNLDRRERIKYIARQRLNHKKDREIARELGITRQRVCRIMQRAGLSINRPGGTEYRGTHLSRRVVRELTRLAGEHQLSDSAMLARIVKAVVDNPSVAKRMLEREAVVAGRGRGA